MEAIRYPTEEPTLRSFSEQELGALCRALGNPIRVQMLRLIMERGSLICREMVEALPLAQSTVSQHLKVLKEADLIVGISDGPRRSYSVNEPRLDRFKDLVSVL
ncbi:MAG: winged helix-turn-helix transcriptional regulator [Alphaproteobacteria bacterium]|nr:winged helix-turn-helix transcriptional regulator [Alphaproteobacteria bacterium]